MKKILFTLLLILAFSKLSAQRDTEHWFAPFSTSNLSIVAKQALYLSTDSLTPFTVTIYNNGNILGTSTISKGSPQVFDINAGDMIGSSVGQLFTVSTKGLYLKGTKPFFATFRFLIPLHGEILSSKGKAGIGKKFYAVAAPITNPTSIMNFTTGILATEDNTTVTISGYSPTVVFSNGITGAASPVLNITLNKGQSYIIEGKGDQTGNKTGFIGAKIVSNKPVSVTNGNFLGEYNIGTPLTGGDIIMDQSVPTERLGKEYIIIKGFGNIAAKTEDVLLVATEDNTQIFINNNPVAVATINEGQHYRVNEPNNMNYIDQGSNHYNMYVKTTKNAYLYQLLAGTANSSATVGFNIIPPLNCLLPRKIDEIGMIEMLPQAPNNVKLNIVTEKGAAVLVNGVTPTPAQGPYSVTGTSDWETYSLNGMTGNVTITSSKAVTAGIAGGSGLVGYGGYFAGFSSIPLIAKQTGECVPGLVLEVDDSYETYQWFRNDVPITGANSNSYTPVQSGNYTVRITVGSCTPATTAPYQVFTCLKESTAVKTICEGYLNIVPAFTSSTQTLVPSTVQIITPPTNGTAIINPTTGVINYVPNGGFTGTDVITYKFCGNDPEFVDCEQITLTLTVPERPVVINATLRKCFTESNTLMGIFDLTSAIVTLQPANVKNYYPSLPDANDQTNEILNPTNYLAADGIVYVRVSNTNGCYRVAEISLFVLKPIKSSVLIDKEICIESETTLDAGPGFNGYLWSTGATTQAISNVHVGPYWVDLKTGECTTRQTVTVYPTKQPVISNIEIASDGLTVSVVGGTAPYQYSLDNVKWQDSNVFPNIKRGEFTVYVRDIFQCLPLQVTVTIPNIINVITPNNDGINDVLDYSALANKSNLVFGIFDRYGIQIFRGDKASGYIWDGTINKTKKVSTGNYWFSITWNETKSKTPIKFSGWILVKNKQ
ncbi:gliding motility-associated C-terminal domain-containing protein [Chryseobacterium sp. Leaf180]|uniref:T9SS type B sorting domain-containing protein n=1 Tax=Chryseobacterium sp. Leaf180 TaxID=1736289 RepID=UPI0009EC7C0B|nr:T9SS type B sorting domain-containing protein [Chryseobacterium sp. Leaf180]